MNLSNIKENYTYKNYKELCLELGETTKTGNAKKSQLKEWERFFDFEKVGNKLKVNEVYKTPKPKIDQRSLGNNAAMYIEHIEVLLLDLLTQEKNEGKLLLSRSRLLKELKMINENYTSFRNKHLDLSKLIDVPTEEINEFYDTSNSTLKSNLETALNRLQRQSLIHWQYALTVCYIDTHIQTTVTGAVKAVKREFVNEKGEKVVTFDTVKPVQELAYREATAEERKIITRIEHNVLNELECQDKAQLFKIGKIEEFYERVKEKLFDLTNILFYYNSYDIVFNDDHIHQKLEQLKNIESKRFVFQGVLNASIMDKLDENAKKRREAAILDSVFDDNIKKAYRIPEDYVKHQTKLSETLIDIDSIIINQTK